nr:ribonuclease H-like domain-containing protein [Tanacetum cinerariifolium]GEX00488.1 ribonuclease H-like domain-containing protein [Tanacetum cinerariifolium]
MMVITNEHQLKVNSIKDAKQLMEAIEKRFGGNAATKKTQRNLLKQQYENFTASNIEILDQTFDRLQKPRNKSDLDTMSMNDLYNNLKVFKPEVKRMSSSNSSIQNMAFVPSSNNNSTNRAVNTAQVVNTANKVSTPGTQVNNANIDNLSDALNLNGNETVAFDKTKVECYNFHKRGHFARECRAPRAQDNRNKESTRRNVPVETTNSSALVSYDGLGGYDWSDQAEEGPNYAPMVYSTSSSDFENSDDENNSVSQPNIEKKTVKPSVAKVEFVKPKQQSQNARKTVKNVEKSRQTTNFKRVLNAVKGNEVYAVKASACWVCKPKIKILDRVSKHNSASITFKKYDYIDAQGRSKLVMA